MQKSGFFLPRPVLLVLAALGLLFAIDLFALAAYRDLELASEKLNQRLRTVEALQPLPMMVLEMQSGMRGFILTGSTSALDRYRAAADRFPGVVQKTRALLVEDERQRQLVDGGAASATSPRSIWIDSANCATMFSAWLSPGPLCIVSRITVMVRCLSSPALRLTTSGDA